MQKILLYYKFTPLADPQSVRMWQKALCEKLQLRGRILLSPHGINGTVGGEIEDLTAYVREMKAYTPFKKIVFKWSDGGREDFPKLSIKVRSELVAFGAAGELEVDEKGVVGGGTHLKPAEVHKLVAERGKDVVFFDGRNGYEAAVGKFKDAVVPQTSTTRDFLQDLAGDTYGDIKNKAVVTYCTGGIRCEVLSVLMKNRGFTEVYQLDGGIATYGKEFGDNGLWEGSLYVFDGRKGMKFSSRAKDIGRCVHCSGPTSNYENCSRKSCNKLVLICQSCKVGKETCSDDCAQQLAAGPVVGH